MNQKMIVVDGNEAAASVAFRLNDIAAIYPITPSSPMGELADAWSAQGRRNIWGGVPQITEMQSEAGAAGAVHGALQGGALATTFTSSQGLLLMIPNLYKIAGELTSYCMHVAARSLATHALSIFGDHSDVMACRQTGFALLSSGTVQEAHDFAAIGQLASLRSRIPFMHFFDGFRTSHELNKIFELSDEQLLEFIDQDAIEEHRERALNPDAPVLRGAAQNPDTFFQAREASNSFYLKCPDILERTMREFEKLTGRKYELYEYSGCSDPRTLFVVMGSGATAIKSAVDHLNSRGEKTGLLTVRLYRPFDLQRFLEKVPTSVDHIIVLDRTKENGSIGEPLYLDVVSALHEDSTPRQVLPKVYGGRYGLSSKEFTPSMVVGIYEALQQGSLKRHFTIGINDDLTQLSVEWDENTISHQGDVFESLFFGLGSDGTVGANKNSIKIIASEEGNHAQGYFVYDSKKSGALTVSHLRFSQQPIEAPWLINEAQFVACHQFSFLEKYDMLDRIAEGGTFLLNAPYDKEMIWSQLPDKVRKIIQEKGLNLFVIDANKLARELGLGNRINTIMQTCFFLLSNVMPEEKALLKIKESISATYSKKGEAIVQRNCAAVDVAKGGLQKVDIPTEDVPVIDSPNIPNGNGETFIDRVTRVMLAGKGDLLPVSAFPVDGTWPTGTTQIEKRRIAQEVPIWDKETCIQCNKCAMVCPHAAIRAKVYDPKELESAPEEFRSNDYRGKEFEGMKYTIQVAPEDCTGCRLCVQVCPAKNKAAPRLKAINMSPLTDHLKSERKNFDFFRSIPEIDREKIEVNSVKMSQFLQPLMEFSGACAGCGETPYIKLATQLFGDRMVIANATGCSSIYGGNLPTTPYTTNECGRGPAWSNSLFEDNAEFGLGISLASRAQKKLAETLLKVHGAELGSNYSEKLLSPLKKTQAAADERRKVIGELRHHLKNLNPAYGPVLNSVLDYLIPRSIWLFGGDGWAFDIGYGGLDHVLSLDHDINILVLDTEVYSNTGGQASKATPIGAAAKFAALGKATDKKDLGLMAMNYGHVYVASIAFGAKDSQTVKALQEAESYPGPSLVIAYSHCIAHGYDMSFGAEQQKRAVDSGVWPLYRYDPRRAGRGEPPLTIDARPGRIPVHEYMKNETRFRMIESLDADRFRRFTEEAQQSARRRIALYEHMAQLRIPTNGMEQEI